MPATPNVFLSDGSTATVCRTFKPLNHYFLIHKLQFVDLRSFAVLGPNGHFRQNSFTEFFNPTSTSPPFFQIFDSAFLDIIGHNPTFNQVAFNATFAFAHEAPIFNPSTGEVFFASNIAGDGGVSHWEISLPAMEAALQNLQPNNGQAVNVPVTEVSPWQFAYFPSLIIAFTFHVAFGNLFRVSSTSQTVSK